MRPTQIAQKTNKTGLKITLAFTALGIVVFGWLAWVVLFEKLIVRRPLL